MEDYLIPYSTLESIVDELLKNKQELTPSAKQAKIKELDGIIGQEIFQSLNNNQLDEMNNLLDSEANSEGDFQAFFEKCGINLEEKIQVAINKFKDQNAGGNNE